MAVYKIKSKTRSWDGETIGILILDAAYPCVPGNVGNATTYPFPVRFKEIRGSSIERLLNERDPELLKPFIEGARELEAEGVGAITGACGFMALFQKQVAESVEIPVRGQQARVAAGNRRIHARTHLLHRNRTGRRLVRRGNVVVDLGRHVEQARTADAVVDAIQG